MTTQTGKKKSQKPVNPVLLVIFGIVVVGGGIYYASGYLTQTAIPVQQPNITETTGAPPLTTPSPNPTGDTQSNGPNTGLVEEKPGASLADDSTSGAIERRDPFEPSNFYTQSVITKNNSALGSKLITVSSTEGASLSTQGAATETVWEGVITAGNNDQVVIIRHKDKPYSLRLGDRLPGTVYIVGQINQDTVILMAPKGKLQLNRKKEVK